MALTLATGRGGIADRAHALGHARPGVEVRLAITRGHTRDRGKHLTRFGGTPDTIAENSADFKDGPRGGR